MSHSEMSLSFSITQLLSLKVRLDFASTTEPPIMSLEAGEQSHLNESAGTTIKLETSIVGGHRIVRLYAVEPPSSAQGQALAISSTEPNVSSSTIMPPPPAAAFPQGSRSNSTAPNGVEMGKPSTSGWSASNCPTQRDEISVTQSAGSKAPENVWGEYPTAMPNINPGAHLPTPPSEFETPLPPALGSNFDSLGDLIGTFDGNLDLDFPIIDLGSGAPPLYRNLLATQISLDFTQCSLSDSQCSEAGLLSAQTPSASSAISEVHPETPFHVSSDGSARTSLAPDNPGRASETSTVPGSTQSSVPSQCDNNEIIPPHAQNISSTSECANSPPVSSRSPRFPVAMKECRRRSSESAPQRQKRHKASKPAIYNCPVENCPRVFRSEYTCRVHSGVHVPKPRKVVHCTISGCEETFTRQHDRLRHEVSQHGKRCEWSCLSCLRFFSSAQMLQKHRCVSYRR